MLKNEYDIVIVGESWPSYLMGLNLLDLGYSVLMVNDPSVEYGEEAYNHIGELEKELFKLWGEKLKVSCLLEVDSFLDQTGVKLHFAEKILELGSSPYANFREVNRKFPQSFGSLYNELKNSYTSADEFDRELSDFYKTAALKCFDDGDFSALTRRGVGKASNSKVQRLVEAFLEVHEKKRENDKSLEAWFIENDLLALIQSLNKHQIILNPLEHELIFCFSQLLSPRYRINEHSFLDKLNFEFQDRGGDYKQTSVESWEIYHGKIETVLLTSYEGIVRTKKLLYMGRLTAEHPFELKESGKHFSSFKVNIKLKDKKFQPRKDQKLVVTGRQGLGSDFPFWVADFKDSEHCEVKYLFPKKPTAKFSFYKNRALEEIRQSLESVFPDLDWENEVSCKLDNCPDTWAIDRHKSLFSSRKIAYQQTPFYDHSKPGNGKLISGIHYLGPSRERSLGAFSLLLDFAHAKSSFAGLN